MGFRQTFRSVPIKKGARYLALDRKKKHRATARLFGIASLIGAVAGTGSALIPAASLEAAKSSLTDMAYYPNCSAARAAGAAPIRLGEPGFRSKLDADGDGIACEPYRR
jgi:Excalibur calcium-binding domain